MLKISTVRHRAEGFVELDVVVRRTFADLRFAYPNGCRWQRLQAPARPLRTAHGDLAETWRISRPFNSSSGSVIAVELSRARNPALDDQHRAFAPGSEETKRRRLGKFENR
ncbi:hypothetical protein EN759_33235 [Mesorhizobium sp. M00.F.Ca.ET.038.03.1.1]|nr:hypothetical protein EN759_33235 [Mesorhizobium sp. M00.F.Ca.ET.038.03.1.1]